MMANKFKVGQDVIVATKEIPDKRGTVRFIGKIEGKPDEYIGVELDEAFGKNNGDYQGKSYFKIEKKPDKGQLYGVFVKAASLKPAPEKPQAPKIKAGKPTAPQPAQGKTKLSNELMEQQNNEMASMKQELQAAYERIRYFEGLDTVKEVESLKGQVRELQEQARGLRLEVEQARSKTDDSEGEKLKEYAEKLANFQKRKEAAEKENENLHRKIQALEEELSKIDEFEETITDLTLRCENVEAARDKYRADLEAANVKLKNAETLGGGKSNQEMEATVSDLNQMVAMLQTELAEAQEKAKSLQQQLEANSTRLSDLVRLQRQLKSRTEEVEALKSELEAFADTEDFIEKLTFAGIKKDQQAKEQAKRLKEYAERVNKLESEIAESQQVIDLQGQEIEHLQQQITKHIAEREEKAKHLALIVQQKNKYKKRVQELNDSNSTLMQNIDDREEESVLKTYFNTDIFQHKYYELSRLHQLTDARFLRHQLHTTALRTYAGTCLANLVDTLPEAFTARLHPRLLDLLLRLSGASSKLYLLFDALAAALTHKSELYTADMQSLAGCYLLLLDQLPILYGSLLKLELAVVSADTEEDVAEILANPDLKPAITRIDTFTLELLERVCTQSIDPEMELDAYIEPVEVLDNSCEAVKRLPTELATRLELCVETMRAVQKVLGSVESYRRNSQARELAQVDTMLESFLKNLQEYLRECCTNPHVRLRNDMRSYLSGLDLVIKILTEIQLGDSLQQLNSLYSQVQDIKMLKDTILTTQFHLKELTNDLSEIVYPTPLSRLHVRLPGRLWQDKLKEMKDELARFEATLAEKAELERVCAEQKRKILLLEKEIKDRQSTKELHQRRIGQLQLKVEQAALIEGEFRRQADKFRSLEEANKLIEDELAAQSRRKKEVEEELRKTKEKFDIFQTETMMKQKKQKSAANLSSEDLSNLAIFKTVLAEAGALRNHDTKRKLHQLAFSPLLAPPSQPLQQDPVRRQAMKALAEVKIGGDFSKIEGQLRQAEFKLRPKQQKQYVIGSLVVRQGRESLRIDVNRTQLVGY